MGLNVVLWAYCGFNDLLGALAKGITMSQELLKLKRPDSKDINRGAKKRFFLANKALIFELIENHSVSYLQIIEAFKKENVNISYDYFRELMATEKNKSGVGKKQDKQINQTADKPAIDKKPLIVAAGSAQLDDSLSQHEQDRLIYKNEVERIKSNPDMNAKQKRAALDEAQARFSKNKTPLNISR